MEYRNQRLVWRSRRAHYLPIHRRYQALSWKEEQHLKKYKFRIATLTRALATTKNVERKARFRKLLKMTMLHYINVRVIKEKAPTRLIRKFLKFDSFSDDFIYTYFRFHSAADLRTLKQCLRIPEDIVLDSRHRCSGEEYLLIGLYKMAYPRRLVDMEHFFGMDYSVCSRFFNHFLNFMVSRWGYLLRDNLDYWKEYFPKCASAIHSKIVQLGGQIDHCNIIGFIDNTLYTCCRPGGNDQWLQEAFYTGWKKIHGIKFQTVDLPNGMTAHVGGPSSARHNDLFNLAMSRINQKLADLQLQDAIQYLIFGDSAYTRMSHIQSKFEGPADDNLPPQLSALNVALGGCRVSIEWGYKEMKLFWALLTCKQSAKIRLRTPSKQFFVGILLKNFICCMYGNQTSEYFDMLSPSLEEYTGFHH